MRPLWQEYSRCCRRPRVPAPRPGKEPLPRRLGHQLFTPVYVTGLSSGPVLLPSLLQRQERRSPGCATRTPERFGRWASAPWCSWRLSVMVRPFTGTYSPSGFSSNSVNMHVFII